MVYVPGKDHHFSDALSRWAYPTGLEQGIYFHGGQDGEEYAQACYAAEDEYDSFPIRALDDPPVFRFIRQPRPPDMPPDFADDEVDGHVHRHPIHGSNNPTHGDHSSGIRDCIHGTCIHGGNDNHLHDGIDNNTNQNVNRQLEKTNVPPNLWMI